MALIECKECGVEVSTKAAACPSCGAPPFDPTARPGAFVPHEIQLPETRVVTTQLTSKPLKALLFPCYFLMLIGFPDFFLFVFKPGLKPLLDHDPFLKVFWMGAGGWILVKIMIWWRHG